MNKEFVELTYLFDNINTAKDVMPELDTISPDILTGVNACRLPSTRRVAGKMAKSSSAVA